MFLIKNFYLLDTFLSGFLLKPKLKKSFLCFCFDIYFKISLVLLLGFKVVHAKNCIRKTLKLRYYATFKVRKFESLFYKINIFLQKIITCIGLQTEQILYVCYIQIKFYQFYLYITYIFFNFGRDFCGLCSTLFLKASASCGETIFK